MSKIGKNIRKIRTVKKLSQASFAEIFNLARPSIGAYEEGRAEPKIDTVIQIANYFGLSIDSLLTKDLTINDLYRFDSIKKSREQQKNTHRVEPELRHDQFNTVFVSEAQNWEYINNFKNTDFFDTLPHHHLPFIKAARAIAFEMPDESMSYDFSGIQKGDYLICNIQVDKPGHLKKDHVYVLVTKETIIIRRLQTNSNILRFGSDNPDFPDIEVDRKDLLETWEVFLVLSGKFHPPVKVNERISFLEGKVDDMANRLSNLEHTAKQENR